MVPAGAYAPLPHRLEQADSCQEILQLIGQVAHWGCRQDELSSAAHGMVRSHRQLLQLASTAVPLHLLGHLPMASLLLVLLQLISLQLEADRQALKQLRSLAAQQQHWHCFALNLDYLWASASLGLPFSAAEQQQWERQTVHMLGTLTGAQRALQPQQLACLLWSYASGFLHPPQQPASLRAALRPLLLGLLHGEGPTFQHRAMGAAELCVCLLSWRRLGWAVDEQLSDAVEAAVLRISKAQGQNLSAVSSVVRACVRARWPFSSGTRSALKAAVEVEAGRQRSAAAIATAVAAAAANPEGAAAGQASSGRAADDPRLAPRVVAAKVQRMDAAGTLGKLTVAEMRVFLKSIGLPTKGRKAEVQQQVEQALQAWHAATAGEAAHLRKHQH